MNHCSFPNGRPRTWRSVAILLLLVGWLPCCTAADGKAEKTPKKQPTFQELLKALDSADEKKSDAALEGLLKIVHPSHLFDLLEAGKSKNPRVRVGIVQCLCWEPFHKVPDTDPPFYEIHDFLVGALKDKDPQVRRMAAACSWGHARESRKIRDALVEAIKDPDKTGPPRFLPVSACAVSTLGGLGTMARPAYRAIMHLAENGEEEMRLPAFRAVGQLAADDKEKRSMLLGVLIRQMRQAKPEKYRTTAAWAISLCREDAKLALPALREALRPRYGKNRRICPGVLCALTAMGPAAKAALPDLLPELADSKKDSAQRYDIVRYIAALKKEGKPALPTLQRIVNDEREDKHFRWFVGTVIEKIKAK
jgi:HEAT repeat protein